MFLVQIHHWNTLKILNGMNNLKYKSSGQPESNYTQSSLSRSPRYGHVPLLRSMKAVANGSSCVPVQFTAVLKANVFNDLDNHQECELELSSSVAKGEVDFEIHFPCTASIVADLICIFYKVKRLYTLYV